MVEIIRLRAELEDERDRLHALVAAVAPLVDPDGPVTAHYSEWEINDRRTDGKELHRALVEAYHAATGAAAREQETPGVAEPGESQVIFELPGWFTLGESLKEREAGRSARTAGKSVPTRAAEEGDSDDA